MFEFSLVLGNKIRITCSEHYKRVKHRHYYTMSDVSSYNPFLPRFLYCRFTIQSDAHLFHRATLKIEGKDEEITFSPLSRRHSISCPVLGM